MVLERRLDEAIDRPCGRGGRRATAGGRGIGGRRERPVIGARRGRRGPRRRRASPRLPARSSGGASPSRRPTAAPRASAASRRWRPGPRARSPRAIRADGRPALAAPGQRPRAGEVELPLGLDRPVALDAAGLEERLDVAVEGRLAPSGSPRVPRSATVSSSKACSHRPDRDDRSRARRHHGGASVIPGESGFIMRDARTDAQPETGKERRQWHWHTSPWRPATLERSTAFFHEVMGWTPIGRPRQQRDARRPGCRVAPGQELHLVEVPEFEPSPFEQEYGRHVAVSVPRSAVPGPQGSAGRVRDHADRARSRDPVRPVLLPRPERLRLRGDRGGAGRRRVDDVIRLVSLVSTGHERRRVLSEHRFDRRDRMVLGEHPTSCRRPRNAPRRSGRPRRRDRMASAANDE